MELIMSGTTQLTRCDSTTATPAGEDRVEKVSTLISVRDSLEIRVQDVNLRIETSARMQSRDGLRLQHAEVHVLYFARLVTLGPEFNTSNIEAYLKDGVLKLQLPRRDEARPRRIGRWVGRQAGRRGRLFRLPPRGGESRLPS